MTAPYRLHYAPDNASLVIRLALEEMRVPYETVLVDRARRGQKSPGYLALNPTGLIPVLETPHGPISETAAILLWLADTHGVMAPAPDDPARAAYLKWLFFASNSIHADLRMTFYPDQYIGPDPAAHRLLRDGLRPRIGAHLAQVDRIAGEAPVWLRADAPSGLCYYLACLVRWMAIYPRGDDSGWFDLTDSPHLCALVTALETRDAVAAARSAEGLGPTPFTAPRHPEPPEGSAT